MLQQGQQGGKAEHEWQWTRTAHRVALFQLAFSYYTLFFCCWRGGQHIVVVGIVAN